MSEDFIGGFVVFLCLAWMVFQSICLAKLATGVPSLRDTKAEKHLVTYLTICIVGIVLAIIAGISNGSVLSASLVMTLTSIFGFLVEDVMSSAEAS